MSESFYNAIAAWYDLEFDHFDADLDLYRGYAEIVGGPLLELGCGTGRLLIPLALDGYEITGIDASFDMLARARARLEEAQLTNGQIRHLDMRRLDDLPDDHFRLVFCSVNSFLHLDSREDQLATLQAARRVLHHRGILIIDVFHPSPSALQAIDDRLTLDGTWAITDGSRVDRFSYRRVHPASQIVDTTLLFDVTNSDGQMRRTSTSYQTRYVHRFEMVGLLESAGLEIESVLGSYALDPFEDDSAEMIFVAHKR
jgi:SAM-dependent methyltransferase